MCLVGDDLRRLHAKINGKNIKIDDKIKIIYHHYLNKQWK